MPNDVAQPILTPCRGLRQACAVATFEPDPTAGKRQVTRHCETLRALGSIGDLERQIVG